MRPLVLTACLVAMVAVLPAAAAAGDPFAFNPVPPSFNPVPPTFNPGPREAVPPSHPHHRFVGRSVVVVPPPVIVVSPSVCTTPGYWAYQWVPQVATYQRWVPGGFAADGTWIEGHYESGSYASGYYQPYWVPGSSGPC